MTVIVFVHIPKAAGNSVLAYLQDNTDPAKCFDVSERHRYTERLRTLINLPCEEKGRLALIHGHMPFGIHDHLPQPVRYVTFLRHPVDRLVSHYYFVLSNPTHYLHAVVVAERMSLIDYARSGLSGELDNGQTRLLCGRWAADSLHGHAPLMSEDYEAARNHLLEGCAVYGLAECFLMSLCLVGATFGWPPPKQPARRNVTKNRKAISRLTCQEWDAIAEMNQYDMALYEVAFSRFVERARKNACEVDRGAIPTRPHRRRSPICRIAGRLFRAHRSTCFRKWADGA